MNDAINTDPPKVELGPLAKLNRDLRMAAMELGEAEVGYLVATYYALQEVRKGMDLRTKALTAQARPGLVMDHIAGLGQSLENQIKTALDAFSSRQPAGIWARSICGIGPVIAAGLLAYCPARSTTFLPGLSMADIDDPARMDAWIQSTKKLKANGHDDEAEDQPDDDTEADGLTKALAALPKLARGEKGSFAKAIAAYKATHNVSFAPADGGVDLIRTRETAGTIWSFAGLEGGDNKRKWERGEKRPWHAGLKTLAWKIGESFVKVSGNDADVYGKVYVARKALETERNARGDYAAIAKSKLETTNVGKTTDLHRHLSAGRLAPAHIHARAKRVAVKLFLSHWHEASYVATFHRLPPAPFAIARLGHAHFIPAPNMHLIAGWEELRAKM